MWDRLSNEWQTELKHLKPKIEIISSRLRVEPQINPQEDLIFRALGKSPNDFRVVIVGQDPYPNPDLAMGLAFSIPDNQSMPPSLRNIKKELANDLGVSIGNDLSSWTHQGVLLLNRILTCRTGQSLSHKDFGWQEITSEIIEVIHRINPNVVGILWGKFAQELSDYFNPNLLIKSAHPSGLSAYRGFFGSKPFSQANELLRRTSQKPVEWG